MFVANLAALPENRPLIVGDGNTAVVSGLAMAIQSPNKEVQNISMRAIANLVQDPELRARLVHTKSPLDPDTTLPKILACQIQVAGAPVQTAFFLSYVLANFMKNPDAARLFVESNGLDCILDLLDTKAQNVVSSTADALCEISTTANGAPGVRFRKQVLDRLTPDNVPPADENWFIWIVNEIFITSFGPAVVCEAGFLPLLLRAAHAANGVTCKYSLLALQKLADSAMKKSGSSTLISAAASSELETHAQLNSFLFLDEVTKTYLLDLKVNEKLNSAIISVAEAHPVLVDLAKEVVALLSPQEAL